MSVLLRVRVRIHDEWEDTPAADALVKREQVHPAVLALADVADRDRTTLYLGRVSSSSH